MSGRGPGSRLTPFISRLRTRSFCWGWLAPLFLSDSVAETVISLGSQLSVFSLPQLAALSREVPGTRARPGRPHVWPYLATSAQIKPLANTEQRAETLLGGRKICTQLRPRYTPHAACAELEQAYTRFDSRVVRGASQSSGGRARALSRGSTTP